MLTTFDVDDYVHAAIEPAPAASCSRMPHRDVLDAIRVVATGDLLAAERHAPDHRGTGRTPRPGSTPPAATRHPHRS